MSHPDYKEIGHIEDRLIEELSELIQGVCKCKRFGYHKKNPLISDSLSNLDKTLYEINDVYDVLYEYSVYLQKMGEL
jgi:hypothetical protein